MSREWAPPGRGCGTQSAHNLMTVLLLSPSSGRHDGASIRIQPETQMNSQQSAKAYRPQRCSDGLLLLVFS